MSKQEGINHDPQLEDFADIELESANKPKFTDIFQNVKFSHLIYAFFLFFVYQTGLTYIAMTSAPLVNQTAIFYPLSQENVSDLAMVKMVLEPFVPSHKFLKLDGSVVRYSMKTKQADPIELNATLEFRLHDEITRNLTVGPFMYTRKFKIGREDSNSMPIFYEKVNGFDIVNITISYHMVYSGIRGFRFKFYFVDPNTYDFTFYARLVFSAMAIYALINYLRKNKFSQKGIFHYPLIIMGLTAINASSPLSIVFQNRYFEILAPIFMCTFMSVFRLFIWFFLDTTIHQKNQANKLWSLIYLTYIVVYGVIECIIGINYCALDCYFDGGIIPYPEFIQFIENAFIVLSLTYCVVVLLTLAYAFRITTEEAHFKVVTYGIFILDTSICTLLVEVLLAILHDSRNSLTELFIYQGSHILSCVIIIYLQYSGDTGYKAIDNENLAYGSHHLGDVKLGADENDIEQLYNGNDENENFEKEYEEEEEEEE
ncbi:hypothetical protein TRFO_23123 [Tritrichomonas foetus]|uniref:Uncharacterized protein n=1 Tax=Tritrichomonas foetus TaxID=1144522 RepID=A0A1J4KF85_9EUKA|nr:hypothetical protein TRFO_23123 [Tritrichomonas foetus]|eukprot:OHT08428.1 hypothetical protein TRFO_23123 [Tritrichomonas foetus]